MIREAPGTEGRYGVTELGQVWSYYWEKWVSVRDGKATLITSLGSSTYSVGSLVLEAFDSPRPAGHVCCHRDDNRTNCTLSNLYWGTNSQNSADGIRNGKIVRRTKLTVDAIPLIRARYGGGVSQASLAEEFGVSQTAISNVIRRVSWDHVP